MSRIGRQPVVLPDGVQATVDGARVSVKGPKGELERTFEPEVRVEVADGEVTVARRGEDSRSRALHGLTRSLIANMVQGVSEGYEKALEIQGVGYRAEKRGAKLVLNVGYSHPVEVDPPGGIEFELDSPTLIRVRGIDKEKVGQVAADIRQVRPPEPYKGKGIRYRGEHVRRKAGKATVGT